MHRGLVTASSATPIGEAASHLVANRVHALVVTADDGSPVGILADTDLLAGEWIATDEERLAAMRELTAGELMSPEVETVDADEDAAVAAGRLRVRRVGRLVVLDGGEPVGVVSISDLVAGLARPPDERRVVGDVMSRGFLACRADAPASALARAMTERRSRSVIVLAEDGAPAGVVTGHDLLPLVGGVTDPPASELMHEPFTITPDASLQEAADLMLRHEVHRLVVVAAGDEAAVPLGIVSTSDIVSGMAAPGSAWRPAG